MATWLWEAGAHLGITDDETRAEQAAAAASRHCVAGFPASSVMPWTLAWRQKLSATLSTSLLVNGNCSRRRAFAWQRRGAPTTGESTSRSPDATCSGKRWPISRRQYGGRFLSGSA